MRPDIWCHKSIEETSSLLKKSFTARKDAVMSMSVVQEMEACPPLKDPKFVSNNFLS